MNILILGAGEVGFGIAQRLAEEGNNVTVVDNNAERLQSVSDLIDVQTVLGQASLPSVLERANAANADLLIAATMNDEVNMMACQVAHSLFQVPTKLARVRETNYIEHKSALFGRDDLPIDHVISPEREAALSIVSRVQVASAVDAQSFAEGSIQVLGLRVSPKNILAGLPLRDLQEALGGIRTMIIAHEHNHRWAVPAGDAVLLSGDSVYMAICHDEVSKVSRALGLVEEQEDHRHVMIIGGGRIGYIVAEELEARGFYPKIIEHNRERSVWLANTLKRSIVIQGDALDRSLLEEENIDRMDDFLALTNDDETNILASLIAKNYKIAHIITLSNRSIYNGLMRQIGLDVMISPRLTTVSSILGHVRKGRVLGVSPLGDGSIEMIEAEALETSDIINTPLHQLSLPPETLIAVIIRDGEAMIPDGKSVIQAQDRVLVATRSESTSLVEKLFEVHLDFF